MADNRSRLARRFAKAKAVQRTVSLTAAAQRLNPQDSLEARVQRAYRQPWQLQAMIWRDSIPEIRYSIDYIANAMARLRWSPMALTEDGETDKLTTLADAGAPPEWVAACKDAMTRLGNGRVALAKLARKTSQNLSTTGEAYLLGRLQDDGTELWQVRSPAEIVVFNDKIMLRESPFSIAGNLGLVEIPPVGSYLSRMWIEHPYWQNFADSPMRALNNECESLMILRRGIRAVGRSRLAGRGILLMPDSMSLPTPNNDSGDPVDEDFLGEFIENMVTPITNEGDAAAVVPQILQGPMEAMKEIRHLDFGLEFDEFAGKTREELVGIIATGLDIPKEVLLGLVDLNHWSAWQVSEEAFKGHLEPHARQIASVFTDSFLHPFLKGYVGLPPSMIAEWLPRTHVWFDAIELVAKPDLSNSALQAHAVLVLSDAALRHYLGFTEDDAPTAGEIEVRMIRTTRNWPANALLALLHELDPELIVPPMAGPPAIPGIDQNGVVSPVDANGSGVVGDSPGEVPTAPQPKPSAPAIPGPPPSSDMPGLVASMADALLSATPETRLEARNAIVTVLARQGINVVDKATLPPATEPAGNDGETPDDTDAAEVHTGVMVAFFLPDGVASKIALPGGEAPAELHLTLAFLGEATDLPNPDGLKAAVKAWAADTEAITGTLGGLGLFTNGPEPVTYASFDAATLPGARQSLVDALKDWPISTQHGFTPHITLAYANRIADATVSGEEITFGTVSVNIAGERTDYPMKSAALTASARQMLAAIRRESPRVVVAPTAKSVRLSRKLSAIDTDLTTQLRVAANAAMLRLLERAGARVRQSVGSSKTHRALIASVKNEHVAAVLGREVVEAKNLTAAGLMTTDWSTLKEQFYGWTAKAQQNALATAMQLVDKTPDELDAHADAVTAMQGGLDAAWSFLQDNLDKLAEALLYSPNVNEDFSALATSADADTLVPTGLIRASVAIAGGSSDQVFGLVPTAIGIEVPAVPLGTWVGGVGTGATIGGLMNSAGATTESYEWEHGPSARPFDPHEELDGLVFSSFTDDALRNDGDFPANAYFLPGDHAGCLCNVTPLWITSADVDAAIAGLSNDSESAEA